MSLNILPNVTSKLRRFEWAAWLLLAAVGVHYIELIARTGPPEREYWDELWRLIPLYPLAGIGFFYGFRRDADDTPELKKRGAPTFLTAWAVFIGYVAVSRVVLTWKAGEPLNETVWLGLFVTLLGLFLTHYTKQWLVDMGLLLGTWVLLVEGPALWGVIRAEFAFGWWMLLLFLGCLSIAYHEYNSRVAAFPQFLPRRLTLLELRQSQFVMLFWLTLIEGACLFYGYRWAEPSFIFAWAVYNVYDVIMRSINVKIQGDPLHMCHILGMGLVVLGTFLSLLGST